MIQLILRLPDSIITGLCANSYSILRTWLATDECGHFSTCDQLISLQDISSPTLIGVPDDIFVTCDNIPDIPLVTANDNCDSSLTVIYSEVSNSVEEGCGTIVRRWSVTDDCGNIATDDQVITVIDITPPLLSGIPGDMTIACTDDLPNPDVSAWDNCDPTLTVTSSEILNTVYEGCGIIIFEWSVSDNCGNTTTDSLIITVEDDQSPTWLTSPGALNIDIDCNDTATLSIAQNWDPVATDLCDNDLSNIIKTSGSFIPGSCLQEGTYTNTWTVTDNCGNSVIDEFIQIITITDNVAPYWDQTANQLNTNLACSDTAGLTMALNRLFLIIPIPEVVPVPISEQEDGR